MENPSQQCPGITNLQEDAANQSPNESIPNPPTPVDEDIDDSPDDPYAAIRGRNDLLRLR